jgi:phosphatidylglycerophosphate synthase
MHELIILLRDAPPLQCGMFLRAWRTRLALHHPFPRFGPANYVTLSRAGVVIVLATLIGQPGTPRLLWFIVIITSIAAALDGIDGWLARRTNMVSSFGARFDMETDAAMILLMSILVWQHGKAGSWVVLAGLMRYLFVAAAAIWPWLARPLTPTRRAKVIAITQTIVLICAIAPIIPVWLSTTAAAVSLALLSWSFLMDIRRLAQTR